jgi:hypothetical protein
MADSDDVPFHVEFDPAAIDDLRARLRNTRRPERETVDDWSQGVPLAFVQDLAGYWCDGYDFDDAGQRLNAWPQFTTLVLDNATVSWFTVTGASSARLNWESAGPAPPVDPAGMAVMMGAVTVPTGCSVFPREIRRPSRRWAEQRFQNIHWWNEPARGGHFAAFEQPSLFVDEVRSSFRALR